MKLPNIVKTKKNAIKELLKTNKKSKDRSLYLVNIFNNRDSTVAEDYWYIFLNEEGNFEDIDAGELVYKLLESGVVNSADIFTLLDREYGVFFDLEQRIIDLASE